jgi:hypothetical protein
MSQNVGMPGQSTRRLIINVRKYTFVVATVLVVEYGYVKF